MEHDKLQSGDIRRPWRRRVAVAAVIVGTLAVAVHGLLPTPQEELAAIDAERAVADTNNAALLYAELLQGEQDLVSDIDPAMTRLLETVLSPVSSREGRMIGAKLPELELPKGLLDPNAEDRTLLGPWTSDDYPELKQWIDIRRDRIDRLMEAAAKPACYFPLLPNPNRMGLYDVPLSVISQHARLLRRDANNDMAEGRIADGLTKYGALISIGRHFQSQPAAYPVLTGIACEAMGLHHLIVFAVTGPVTEGNLNVLTGDDNDLEDHWDSVRHDITRVGNTLARTLEDPRSLRLRLHEWYAKIRCRYEGWNEDRVSELYHRVLCERRAYCIVVELRRFKERTGHWSDRLDEIAPALNSLALIDPQNGGPYVYRVDQTNGFELYSAGPDGQDDRRRQGSDDWPIWPRNGGLRRQNPNESTTYESVNPVPIDKGGR